MKTEAYKKYACKALLSLLSVALMQGCVKDGNDLRTGGDEVMVRVEVDVRSGAITRGMSDSDENTVSTIDVYHFVKQSDGKYRAMDHDPAQGTFTDGPPSWINAKLHTYPGKDSRLVIVVNARRADNYGYGPTVELDAFLAGLVLEETGEWYNGTTRYLPMYAITGDVEIKEGIPNGEIDNGGNPFALIRMHAKFNVRLKTPLDAGTFELASVCVFNRKTQGFIPYDPAKLDTTLPTNPKATAPHIPSTTGNVYIPTPPYYGVGTNISDPDYGMIVNKQYVFEVDNAGQPDRLDKTALVIGRRYGADPAVTYYRVDIDVTGGNILRNRLYDVEIQSVTGSGYDTAEEAFLGTKRIDAKITDWAIGGNLISDPGSQRYLWLSDLEFEAHRDGESFTMIVDTNASNWTAVASDSDTDPTAAGASWLTVSPANGTAGTHTLSITAAQMNEFGLREGYIHITAGERLTAVVKVTQAFKYTIPSTINTIAAGYVGAFWRNNQTGERLIRMTATGPWTATVVEGTNWIVLDTGSGTSTGTDDPGVTWTAAGNPADMLTSDALYQVSGTATSVNGTTNDIYFRIGLKSVNPNAVPRYGIILVSYGTSTPQDQHLIFVRQGEDPDYLMRPEDNNSANTLHTMTNGTASSGGTVATPRPQAAKYSPYNLTATEYNGTTNPAGPIQIPQRLPLGSPTSGGGVFTDYPSQAGAFFKWAGEAGAERYAYHPRSSTNILNTYNNTAYWSSLADVHETCPPGYRRPTDGSTTAYNTAGAIALSEMRQSLYLNPWADISNSPVATSTIGNIVWGYYADGNFDRHAITSYTTVRPTTSRVAYIGNLYYNPDTYASLFMPAAGYRRSGTIIGTGITGYYWSSSADNDTAGLSQGYNSANMYQYFGYRDDGFSVRCVQE